MCTRNIVIVMRETFGRREITEFDDEENAARFIEELLEGGAERHSIRVLAGQSVDFEVHQKPVVALVPARLDAEFTLPVDVEETEPVSTAHVEQEAGYSESFTENELVPVAASAESRPYVRDGIRFSTLFKPAY